MAEPVVEDEGEPAGLGVRAVAWLDRLPRMLLPAVVAVLAFGTRVLTLSEARAGNPLLRGAFLDDAAYLDLARGFVDGSGAGQAWFLAPLYPWVLGLVGQVTTLDMLAASSVSVVAGGAAAVVTALAARALHSQAAGYVAGALHALAGTFVFHDVLPGQEPILALLHVAGFWAALVWLRRGTPWIGAAVGAITGVAMLGRGTAVAIGAAAAVLALRRVTPRPRAWRGVALLALGTVVVLLPAAIRNATVVGDFTPFPWSLGTNLHMSNGPASRQHVAFTSAEFGGTPEQMAAEAWRRAEASASRELRPSEVSAFWRRRTWDQRGSTIELVRHGLKKAALFWSADEYGNNHWVRLERRYATWLALTPVSAWWLLALGLGGWWLVRRRVPEADLAALIVLLVWLQLVVMFPVARYRLPVLPMAAICAGAGAAGLLARRGVGRLRIAAVLVVAASVVAHATPREAPSPVRSYLNLAWGHMLEGDDDAARAILLESFESDPSAGRTNDTYGRLLVNVGKFEEALAHLRRADRHEHTRLRSGTEAIYAFVRLGRIEEADGVVQHLLGRYHDEALATPEFLANWALVSWAKDERDEARDRLARAEALAPNDRAVLRARDLVPR